MKIEVLFPDLCQLYGDRGNALYLKASLPQADWNETVLSSPLPPRFTEEPIDLLLLGSMTEQGQRQAIEKLRLFLPQLHAHIARGGGILATGNSAELFGKSIEQFDGKTPGLGLYDFEAKLAPRRLNEHFLGRFGEMPVTGFHSQFTVWEGEFPEPLFEAERGWGRAPGDPREGWRDRNFFATSLLGPLLVQNPAFTKALLALFGENEPLAFESAAFAAAERRLAQLRDPETDFDLGGAI